MLSKSLFHRVEDDDNDSLWSIDGFAEITEGSISLLMVLMVSLGVIALWADREGDIAGGPTRLKSTGKTIKP